MLFSPEYIIGVALSLSATIIQNVALGCMKLVHIAEEKKPPSKQRQYYQIPKWYVVFLFNIIGVVFDFISLSFLPSSVAMPIGSLGLIVSTLFAWRFAGEVISLTDVLGIVCIVVGSWVSVLFSGGAQRQKTAPEFLELFEYGSVSFVYFLLIISLILTALQAHKRIARNPLVCACVPGLFGAVTNICGKGTSNVLLLTLSGRSQLKYVFSYVLILATVTSVLVQNHMLQRALSLYDQVIVVPIYYVTLCICCVFNGLFFLGEFKQTSTVSNIIFALGIASVVIGAVLLAQKHMKRTAVVVHKEPERVEKKFKHDRFMNSEGEKINENKTDNNTALQVEELTTTNNNNKQICALIMTPTSEIAISQ